jgi:hypothetical protein
MDCGTVSPKAARSVTELSATSYRIVSELTNSLASALAWGRTRRCVSWRATGSALCVRLVCAPVAAADSVTVNTAADLAPALGECSGGDSCSLRQALDAAHTGDTIVVPVLGWGANDLHPFFWIVDCRKIGGNRRRRSRPGRGFR